ncbi:MAG: hemerythrin domain-containing protein [Zoogloeaceae bacterium]|mgnify:CR=1 FL=1|nr:hemerythrin domain-containing protein [Zoogloeaceae bacterium]
MTPPDNTTPPASIGVFTDCHAGILSRLDTLEQINSLLEPARQARQFAAKAVAFFDHAIIDHHEDEERELFPAACKAAAAGPERDEVVALTERLTQDHRLLEGQWKALRPALERIAKGGVEALDVELLARLLTGYRNHARFEETQFLPLATRVLSRKDPELAELGYALHIRHAMKSARVFT